MIKPRLFLCSGTKIPTDDPRCSGREVYKFDALDPNGNVHLQIEDVAKAFSKHLTPRLVDLLEIATYVYTADCATPRGEEWSEGKTKEPWDRDFRFIIPVRDYIFWNNERVIELLTNVLEFLSNDKYTFDFCQLLDNRPVQPYLAISDVEEWPFYGVERVLMFSGGLDSLAGAVETAARGEKLVLVSHRPVITMDRRQRALVTELRKFSGTEIIHVPVWVNKEKTLGREHTQRTRSFLFSALGTVVAESLQANGVRFFENGVVSLNLPIADEVLRARASRTTHPVALNYLSELYSLVTGREFKVDNPFIFSTKTEVVSLIAKNDAADLIKHSCSCARTGFFRSKNHWHCGVCSQCIDRRIAMYASGLEKYDPSDDYENDVFVGSRDEGYAYNMAVDYVRHAQELSNMSEEEMATKFNLEISRSARFFENRREAAQSLIQMHKRHGEAVAGVLEKKIAENAGLIWSSGLPRRSLLSVITGSVHQRTLWSRYAEKIGGLLETGVPIICKNHAPEGEKHLQEICDGILHSKHEDLVREFPFQRWGSVLTKPDWSNEDHRLWVELKYIRKKEDIRPITEDIAADITKYGDNGYHVLYVVYDRYHYLEDDREFAEPIECHEGMLVRIIR